MGREWSAVAEGSLTCSVVLRDPALTPIAANLGQMAACAVLDSLRKFGIDGMVKWPNDVMVGDGKVAGVLVEQGQAAGDYVVGVGLNVNLTEEEFEGLGLDRPALSMRTVTGRCHEVEDVLSDLVKRFSDWIDKVGSEGLDPLWVTWGKHDWLAGRAIRVLGIEGVVEGVYLGVDELGRLRLGLESGVEERCWTGDVERVRLRILSPNA